MILLAVIGAAGDDTYLIMAVLGLPVSAAPRATGLCRTERPALSGLSGLDGLGDRLVACHHPL